MGCPSFISNLTDGMILVHLSEYPHSQLPKYQNLSEYPNLTDDKLWKKGFFT